MAAVTVQQAQLWRSGGSEIAAFYLENGNSYSLHWTSEAFTVGGVGWSYANIERQGRKPLVRKSSQKLRTMSFSTTVTAGGLLTGYSAAEITQIVGKHLGLADLGVKVRLVNVSDQIETTGWWYMDLQVQVTQRDELQQVKQATLSWTLTEANDERPKIARIPPPPPPPPPPAVASPAPTGQADYTVVRGDSLWKIAARFLGNGTRWRELFDLNQARLNLAPPVMYAGLLTVWIYPGQVMKIPAR